MSHDHKLCIIYEHIDPNLVKRLFNDVTGELTLVAPFKLREQFEPELADLRCRLYWHDLNAATSVGTYQQIEMVAMASKAANWHFEVLKKATTSPLVDDLFDKYRDPLVYSIQDLLFGLLKSINNCVHYIDAVDYSEIYVLSRKKKTQDLRFSCFKEFITAQVGRIDIQWMTFDEKTSQVEINIKKISNIFIPIFKYSIRSSQNCALGFLARMSDKLGWEQKSILEKFNIIIKQTRKKGLLKWPSNTWVVVSNYDPSDYRTNPISRRLLGSMLRYTDCLAVHKISADKASVESLFQELTVASITPKAGEISFWGDKTLLIENIQKRFFSNNFLDKFSIYWTSLCKSNEDNHFLSSTHMSALSTYLTSIRGVKNFFNVIGFALVFEEYLSINQLKGLLFVGGEHDVFSRALIIAARSKKVPTFSYNFLVNYGNPLSRKPLCDQVLVSDSTMAETYAAQYLDLQSKLVLSGSHVIDARRFAIEKLEKNESEKRSDKLLLLYATQPLGKPSVQCLDYLIAALKEVDCRLIVRPHPSEVKAGTVEVYHDTIALNQAHDWIEVDHESDINECLAAADVVFTIFSNVGIEAAVLGKLVGTLQLPGIPVPFDLSKFGIATKLDSEKLIRDFVLDAMIGGSLAKSCREKQNQFLQKNPQLLHGTMEERVLPILLQARSE